MNQQVGIPAWQWLLEATTEETPALAGWSPVLLAIPQGEGVRDAT